MYQICPVRVTESKIIIYSPDCIEIACHNLAEKGRKNRYVGMPEKKTSYVFSTKDVKNRLLEFGQVVGQYIETVKQEKPNTYRSHWRHLLELKVNYTAEDIVMAVKRASKYRIYESQAIENFLKINAQRKSEFIYSSKPGSNENK